MTVYTVNATCELAELTAKLCAGDPLKKRIIFCEDKFTLELEIALSRSYGGTFGTRVFTFNRFMHKYLPETRELLSPESAALVIKRLLLENKGELTCFKNVYDPNLASVVYELIAQLKSAKITPADLTRAADGCTGILRRKLDDICLLFSDYERFIKENNLTDGNNRLSGLPAFFDSFAELKDTEIIIAGFPSLNRTLCEIFKSLVRNAKSVTFALVAGDNVGVYTNETFNFAMSEFDCKHIAVDGSEVRKRLLDTLFAPGKTGKYCPDVHIYRAQSVAEEVEHIARLIAGGVRNNSGAGRFYKDYAVCAENISSYALTVKRVFADYNIPCFIDSSEDLGKHPLTTLVSAYIDTVKRGFSLPDYLRFVKNPLVSREKSLSDGFENYVLKHAIDRKSIFKPFTCEDEGVDEFEKLRAFSVGLFSLMPVREKGGVVSFAETAETIRKLLETIDAKGTLEELGERLSEAGCAELAAYNAQSYEKFCEVLSAAEKILEDKALPLVEVKNVIVSGMTACKISVIQDVSDCVFVGDFRAVKYKEYPVLFALGMTDEVPSAKLDSALLCDRDIAGMEAFDVSVEPKIKEVNRRNRENACMALAAFSNRLYLSRASRSIDGEERKSSEIIDYVIAAFSDADGKKIKVSDKSDYARAAENIGGESGKRYKALPYMTERSSAFAFAREIFDYKDGKKTDIFAASAYYQVMKGRDRSLPDGLLGAVNTEIGYYTEGVNYAPDQISATSVEGFFICPYKNFLSRGVKLNSREEGIRANVIGNLIHEAAQEFTHTVDYDSTKEQARLLAGDIFEKIAEREEFSRYRSSASGKAMFGFLKKETVRFCLNVFDGCNNSAFRPKFIEIAFGFGGDRPPIGVDTRAGKRKIIGKADRIDVFDDKMTVIDYKTGSVGGKDVELYSGKKLQLYLYAKAFSEDYKTVGVYYYPIADEFGEDEEAVMAMRGKTLADLAIASQMDFSISDENRKGRYIGANLTERKGGGFRYDNALLSREEFDCYLEYALQVAAEGVSEINEGVIIPSPDGTACSYCEYHGLCGYDKALDCRTREFKETINKETLLSCMHGDNEKVAEKESHDDFNAEKNKITNKEE